MTEKNDLIVLDFELEEEKVARRGEGKNSIDKRGRKKEESN